VSKLVVLKLRERESFGGFPEGLTSEGRGENFNLGANDPSSTLEQDFAHKIS
jgi:hypothetical protein